jgi:hypothetical protein
MWWYWTRRGGKAPPGALRPEPREPPGVNRGHGWLRASTPAAGSPQVGWLLERAEDSALAELAGPLDGVGHHVELPGGRTRMAPLPSLAEYHAGTKVLPTSPRRQRGDDAKAQRGTGRLGPVPPWRFGLV